MTSELTDWYPGGLLPMRVGWYDVERRDGEGNLLYEDERLWWDGTGWKFSEFGIYACWVKGKDRWRGRHLH